MHNHNLDQQEIKIGKWHISDQLGILASPEGKSVVIEPRLSKLLFVLASQEKSILSRAYLMDHLWPDTIVNEESLTRAVADLRKLLAHNFETPPTIETIRKRGYQVLISPGPKVYALKWKVKKKQVYGIFGLLIVLLSFWIFS